MPDPLEYVVKGAIMKCNMGTSIGELTPTHNQTINISEGLVATKADKTNKVNIPSFGNCNCGKISLCEPTPTDWVDTYKVKVKGQDAIIYKSKLPCGKGGIIKFVTSGQVPIPEEEIEALAEKFNEKEEENWKVEMAKDGFELVPIAGSAYGAKRAWQKGEYGGVALNVVFLGMDVAGFVTAGGTTALSTFIKGARGAKAGVKGIKAARAGAKGAKGIKAGIKGAKGGAKGAKAGAKGAKGGIKLAKGALEPFAEQLAKKSDEIAEATGKVCVKACFPAGTPIAVKEGYKNIEDIKVGDLVWAYNEETGKSDLKPVVNTVQNEADATVKITLKDEIIESTVEHPFYTRDGWKDAADLTTEDEIKTKDGTWNYIKKIVFEYQRKKVYNFEVKDWHTYFVGTWRWLVHNANCIKLSFGKNANKKIRKHIDQIRKRYKDKIEDIPKASKGGIDKVKEIIQDRISQGGGRPGPFAGESAIFFEDEGVSYVIRKSGEFWTILKN